MNNRYQHGRGNKPMDRNMAFPGAMFGGEPGYADVHQAGPPYMPQGGMLDKDPYTLQAQVIVIDPDRRCRDFAEMILSKLKRFGLMSDIIILDKFSPVNQVIDDAMSHGLLYIVSVNVQNEMHQSATVNILQGQPQEHRNMPLEDAFKLVSRHFDAHLLKLANSKLSEPASIAGPDDRGGETLDDIDPALSLLLIGLAEGKNLKLAELDQVLDYLIGKRERITGTRGYGKSENRNVNQQSNQPKPVQPPISSYNKFGQTNEAHDLQAKITKLFGDSNKQHSTVGVKSSAFPSDQHELGKKAVGIDFTNPTVQNALNSLMKTGPQLLDDIKHTSAVSSRHQEQKSTYQSSSRHRDHPDDRPYEEAVPKKRAKPGRHAIAGFF